MERALPDRYELRGRLGDGGFGDVFQALDRRLDRLVAVKAVLVKGTDGLRLAGDEAKILAQLNHPHLVNVFDAVDVDDLFLLFMEFVAGKSLDTVSRSLSPETVCGIGLAAADALAYVHGRQLLHRDIKPANLLLADDGTLKIVDFGIAKLLEHTAAFGSTGTPFWMAPEQRNFAALGPGTDLYSLGLVLYSLFTGQLPARPRVGPLTGVHPALAGVVMRAVDEDIDARYPSAQEFAVALAEAAAEVFAPGWLTRSGLILRVDEAIREAATRVASAPIQPNQPNQPNQPTPRCEDAVGPLPRDGVEDRPKAPSGQPGPAAPGSLGHDENQSRSAGSDAELSKITVSRDRDADSPAGAIAIAHRSRKPLLIGVGVLLTALTVLLVVVTIVVTPSRSSRSSRSSGSSSPMIVTVAGAELFTGDGGSAAHAQLAGPSGVAVDSTGTLYIADPDSNRVRRVDTNGTITTVAGTGTPGFTGDGGPAAHAQLTYPTAVAAERTGTLYIADQNNQRIRRIGTDGTISTVAGTGTGTHGFAGAGEDGGDGGDGGPATHAQLAGPSGVAVDNTGTLYIADSDNHRVRRVGTDGIISTIAGIGTYGFSGDGGPATHAQLSNPTGVTVDNTGTLYIADQNNHRIRRVSTNGTITTVTGTGTYGFAGDSGPATHAQLAYPTGVTVDNTGTLYIADRNSKRVRRVGTDGTITTVAGTGTYGFAGDGGPATDAQLAYPTGVAVDNTGTLYIADQNNQRIRRVSTDGTITTVAGTGTYGFAGDGGPATHAQLTHPSGVAVDNTGTLYIADQNSNCVRRIGTDGRITTVAGTGTFGYSGDGGPATHAQLAHPTAVAVDNTGTLYIADQFSRIRKVGTDGTITTVAGTGIFGYSGDGGPATHAQLAYPTGVTVDNTGTLYIADQNNQRIRRVSTDGTITTVAGTGTYGFAGDGGPAAHAQLAYPTGVAVDNTGTLYIADGNSNRVRRIGTDGTITTVAGTGTYGYSGDGGPAIHAQLAHPTGVAVDNTGTLYIADQYNNCVRRIGTDGTITTVAGTGTGTPGYSGDGGPATHAQLAHPTGVAVDNTGTLYIADQNSNRVRRVSTDGH
ncbi:protein kinase domain-containing protein [Frankia sp. Cas3]|uniref:NHL domain-containing protein n=1 Tax=Frankia sp. Cas3 TaxID=3073926 RepID=UPI002AD46E8F|nr:protein kinase [Frankia sp. Cas3]